MSDARRLFLSTLPAERTDRRLALAAVLVSGAIFLVAAPFARVRLAPVFGFIPVYEAILVVTDLITALLLFGQFGLLRTRGLLVLAGGYLFTGLITIAHALTFPGLFAPTGLLGAGPQSTAWLYMFWHGGFPLLVAAYAMLSRAAGAWDVRPRLAIGGCAVVVLAAVAGLTALATAGQHALPAIMQGNQYTPAMLGVVGGTWALSLLALAALWRRRPHSVLDLWLMVVMGAWLCDIALSAVLNAGRFDLGFYAGRIYGLLASSFVLAILLIEHTRLYAGVVAANATLEEEVSERRRAEARADSANRAKSDFLSRMSHELRTPLNAILGFGQLLDMGSDDALRRKESVQQILKAGRHLLGLINEVLDIARIEAGKLSMSLEPVAAAEVIDATLALMRPQAAGSSIRLPAAAATDVSVLADRQRLQQVLLNLLSNAVKYNRQGGEVFVTCNPAGPGRARIAVRDTGPGIAPDKLQRLFTPFDRLDAEASTVEGTGLGLALSRHLVEAMGGVLTVDSRVGEGTTFTVELSVAALPDLAAVEAAAAMPTAIPATTGRVLYVEDNTANIQLVEHVVGRRPGVSLLVTMQGRQALELARAHRPGLVLLDLHLPDISGEEVLARLREDATTRDIPVVVMSADATPARVTRLLAAGARSYLTKPIDVAELLALLDSTLAH